MRGLLCVKAQRLSAIRELLGELQRRRKTTDIPVYMRHRVSQKKDLRLLVQNVQQS